MIKELAGRFAGTKCIVGLFVSLWVVGFAVAQEQVKPKPGTPGAGAKSEPYRGTIFEISTKEGKTLTIAGSVHMLRASDHPLPKSYEKAFKEAETLVFEIPPSEMTSPKNIGLIQRSAFFTDGTTLKDHLSEKTYTKLQKLIDEKGIPVVPQMRPWLVTQVIGLQEFAKQGFGPQHGVDMHFEAKGIKAGKKIEGLETLEFQLNLFVSIPDKEQEDLLKQTLDDLGEAKVFLKRMMDSWRGGDAEELSEVLNEAMEESPKLGKALLYDRNKNWVRPLEAHLASGKKVMVIVGAGHLVGKGSVIELLKKKGYKAKQL